MRGEDQESYFEYSKSEIPTKYSRANIDQVLGYKMQKFTGEI